MECVLISTVCHPPFDGSYCPVYKLGNLSYMKGSAQGHLTYHVYMRRAQGKPEVMWY